MSRIQIHQAFYGEVNRAHSQIFQTIYDPELTSFLIKFTDRPAALPPGIELDPYFSGSSFEDYYIFTKTFPDPSATRTGMVFTHVLLIELNDVKKINKLQDIFEHFTSSVPQIRSDLKPLTIDLTGNIFVNDKLQPKYVQQVISSFIKGESPILFSGNLDTFKTVIQKIWNSPNTKIRERIKYRTSFSPVDIAGIHDLTIVTIQKELISKWQPDRIICSEKQELVEITSPSEAYFLGQTVENPFNDFLIGLNINILEPQAYNQVDILYSDYISIFQIRDPDVLRRDVRIISKLSPDKNDGKTIKSAFIQRITELVNSGQERNIKALRNIQWSAFYQGEEIGKKLTVDIITKFFCDEKFGFIQTLAEIVDLAINEPKKNWWHDAVKEALKMNVTIDDKIVQNNVWRLLEHSTKRIKDIFKLLPFSKDCEELFRKFIPETIHIESSTAILIEAQKRRWFLLYADLLLIHHKPEKALEKQIAIENTLKSHDSVGVNYLFQKVSDDELLNLTLNLCNDKLITELSNRILRNESILNSMNLRVSCWLNIWTSVLNLNQNLSFGLEGKERSVVFAVFDLALEGLSIKEIVFDLISNTKYSDISEYKERQKVWDLIPVKFRDKFVDTTSQSVLTQLLSDKIESNSIEKILYDRISSVGFMTSFLHENKSNIEPVIKIYESFSLLQDRFLADYITYYNTSISENQSRRLGSIIYKRKLKSSARSVYEKSRYYPSFVLAFEICRDLVNLNWWESLWSNSHQSIEPEGKTLRYDAPMIKQSIDALPTVVILTAIQVEYDAVRMFLKEVVEADRDDTTYEVGLFELGGKDLAKVIIRECGAKNTIAAQETERAIRNFKPSAIFFVGIAGSRKPRDFSIGDVIFPVKIYSYEGGRSDKNAFSSRPDLGGTSYTLSEIAKKERRKPDWKLIIKNGWGNRIKANLGVIASGEQLVEHYESKIGKLLTKYYDDTSAVEMEGFGFAKAATRQGRETSKMMIGVVRGISDIIEQPTKKSKGINSDRRPENAKQLASDTAAAFAFWLISKTFP